MNQYTYAVGTIFKQSIVQKRNIFRLEYTDFTDFLFSVPVFEFLQGLLCLVQKLPWHALCQ